MILFSNKTTKVQKEHDLLNKSYLIVSGNTKLSIIWQQLSTFVFRCQNVLILTLAIDDMNEEIWIFL